MKKQELVNKIENITNITDIADIKAALAELAKECAPKSVGGDGTKLKHYITVHELVREPNENYPAQMLKCHELLVEEFGLDTEVELADVKQMFADKADELKTRQDPERIYNFYQARMANAGWISRDKYRVAE